MLMNPFQYSQGPPQMTGPMQGNRLPFQQINPNNDKVNTDSLLEQRINQRNMEAPTGPTGPGGFPQQAPMPNYQNPQFPQQHQQFPGQQQFLGQPQQQLSQQQQQFLRQQPSSRGGSLNIHPAVIQKFLLMTPAQQQQFAATSPEFYQKIMESMPYHHNPNPQQEQDHQDQGQPDEHTSEDESSDMLENSHSSEDDTDHELKIKEQPEPEPEPEKSKKKHYRHKNKHRHRHHQPEPHERELQVKPSISNNNNVDVHHNFINLSVDFRKDLIEIDNDTYVLGFPTQHNIASLELVSCLINRNVILDREPYIYMNIDEIEGDYELSDNKHIYGKLIQEKTVNEFIVYKPENCIKKFDRATRLDKISISFLKYDLSTVPLNKIVVRKIRKNKDTLRISTKYQHYLVTGDEINVCSTQGDSLCVDKVEVLDVLDKDLFVIEVPINNINGSGLQFEKVNLKCTLSFKITTHS